MFTEDEKKVISAIQDDIPVSKRPYSDIAENLGMKEEKVIEIIKKLCKNGCIRRFGATIRHQKSGFNANAMAAWKVEESRIDEVGKMMALSEHVSHCYSRNPDKEWNYNLYTMIHAVDKETCRAAAQDLAQKTGVDDYNLLFSVKELKKTSMRYFS